MRRLGESVCDYFIICEGGSPTQVKAIADSAVVASKRHLNDQPHSVEGMATGEWVIVDLFDIAVHVFVPKSREFYQLEELWSDADATYFDSNTGRALAS